MHTKPPKKPLEPRMSGSLLYYIRLATGLKMKDAQMTTAMYVSPTVTVESYAEKPPKGEQDMIQDAICVKQMANVVSIMGRQAVLYTLE